MSMGILQAIILKWVAIPSSRGSSQPRDRTQVFCKFFSVWATKEAQKSWIATCKKMKLRHSLTVYAKIKLFKDLGMRHETINLLEKNIGKSFSDINHSNIFLDWYPKAKNKYINAEINKWALIKLKSFCKMIRKVKDNIQNGRKYLQKMWQRVIIQII